MLLLLKGILVRLAAARMVFKLLGALGLLAPLMFILKIVGVPILAILAIIALPVLFVLFLIGLPIFLVLIVGGMILGLVFSVLSMGLVALKFALIVVLPAWLIWKLARWMFRSRGPAPDAAA